MMPVARFKMPDGRVARFDVPEGTSPEAAQSMFDEAISSAGKSLSPTGSFGENFAAGMGKAAYDAGRGMGQLARYAMPDSWADRAGLPTQSDIDEAKERDKPLMRTGGGVLGNIAGNVGMMIGLPGPTSAGGAAAMGGALGAIQPTATGESRLLNIGIGAAAGYGGKKVGDWLGKAIAEKLASSQSTKATAAAQNQVKDATLQMAKGEGYVVPPTQAKADSAWNQILEGISGKVKTGQAASVKNQEVTNRLAREALRLPPDAPLNSKTLKDVRDAAGGAYDALAGVTKIAPDAKFDMAVQSLARNRLEGATSNPADEAIDGLIGELRKFGAWHGRGLVSDVKNLREMARANFAAADRAGGDVAKNALGRAQFKAAELLEELAERNLKANGAPQSLVRDFRAARELIAKSYTVENALNEATGNVVGAKLAQQLAKGKPLTGELEKAASFAMAFPDSARDLSAKGSSFLANSPLDWALGGGLSAATGNPAGMAVVAARPAARGLILSKPYQAMMTTPNYSPNALLRYGAPVINNAMVQRSLPMQAAAAGLLYADQQEASQR